MTPESILPRQAVTDGRGQVIDAGSPGLTVRDYFAAKAMQALIPLQFDSSSYGTNPGLDPGEGIALDAYAYADAMLKERAKP